MLRSNFQKFDILTGPLRPENFHSQNLQSHSKHTNSYHTLYSHFVQSGTFVKILKFQLLQITAKPSGQTFKKSTLSPRASRMSANPNPNPNPHHLLRFFCNLQRLCIHPPSFHLHSNPFAISPESAEIFLQT